MGKLITTTSLVKSFYLLNGAPKSRTNFLVKPHPLPTKMPTIVTEIVNNMFRNQRNKRAFAAKLREIPVESESEVEDSDAESLDKSLDASRDFVQLAANQPREDYFLWGTELSRSKDVFVLKLDEDINEDEERHLLLLKNFCLGLNAIEGERNVVEIHTTDFSDKEQRHPVASLTLGQKDFANVDLCLTFSKTKEVKFKLVMGSGPVTITGNHYVEYLTVPEEDDDPDFVAEETDDETEISTFEDPEEIDESELKDLAEERAKPVDAGVNGSAAPSGGEGKRKRAASPSEPTMKKRKSDSEDVSVKEVDLKA